MNWMDRPCTSADERDGLVQDLVVFSSTFRFFVNSHLDHSLAWIPACSPTAALCTDAFPPIFLQLRKGPM